MSDILLSKFFEMERWEKAIETCVDKDIDKGELRKLCSPEVRAAMYQCIVNDNYEIAPPHQVKIPKDNGDFRIVYVNENVDRLFLSIVNDMLFEMCRSMIHKSCKSYQKGIGCGKIVQEVSRKICESYEHPEDTIGFKADLSKYFDSVPIRFIDQIFDNIEAMHEKSKIIDVLRKYYHADLCFDVDGNLIEHYQSLKQGCAVASFLADVALSHIDQELSDLPGYYVRYSDDLLYIGPDYDVAMELLKMNLDEMEMKLNPKKVEYLNGDTWFKFLGFQIKGSQITLSKSRVKSFQKEIASRSTKLVKISAKKALNNINKYLYVGDGTYSWATSVLPIINVQKDIDTLNEYVLDSIRACITGGKRIGGLGVVDNRSDSTIIRGTGRNVKANKKKTCKEIEGFKSLRCMQNVLLTNRAAYDTLVRAM